MEKIGLNELRTCFKEFYEKKDHLAHASFSLVPEKDKSLLLINSGMAPLKPYFAGLETPPKNRMTTCQKCIRTGDLENVGYTARHGTFFEMLGSFSFGDYFKTESLLWGWEFITEVLKMPVENLWATIYEDDDEAYDIWVNEVGIAPDRIVRMGKKDNFWEIGIGPCGPCSEIYYDRGESYGCGKEDCRPGCECDRYVEFWNHVFTQFNRDEAGNYTPLAHPNIDTGMGLERLACIMQNTDSIFDVDTIKHILDGVVEISGVPYQRGEALTDVSIRIITDHIRSVTFMIADGIIPSNEGRGYVLRRLLRRALVHGRKLGIEGLFLVGLANKVIAVSGEEYPGLIERRDYIHKLITLEEERFSSAVDLGQELLGSYIDELKSKGETKLSGDKVFKLYDTHGFNPELTKEILEEHGIGIDEEGYQKELKRQQETSRANIKTSDSEAWHEDDKVFKDLPKTEFLGYETLTASGKVLLILAGTETPDEVIAGARVGIVLDKTPFYAESGGQASDIGFLTADGVLLNVESVRKVRNVWIHEVAVAKGAVKIGDELVGTVDAVRRNQTARNHTATHLLHKALREVLGNHVQQAGSSVDPNELRFDFTHYEGIDENKLAEIETIVNRIVNEFLPVDTTEQSIEDAKKSGATALFDEKYGDVVRVVRVGDFSMELCGGTHVDNSGEIGAFKIVSETSVGSGTRRIEAITGTNVLAPLDDAEGTISALGELFKTNPDMILNRAAEILKELKEVKKELAAIKKDEITSSLDELLAEAVKVGDVKLIRHSFTDLDIDDLRKLSDDLRAKEKGIIIVLATITDGKTAFVVSVSDDLQEKGYHAGKLIKEIAAAAGGGGGGKADMAQAGGKDPDKVPYALETAINAVKAVTE